MIRSCCLAAILMILCFSYSSAYAQDVSKLTLPASPAFSVLNFEPTAIMRPATAKSLATDILNSFDKNGKLILNLGLEAAPYWLGSHPGLTREKYLHANPGQTILQSFSLSAATVKDSSSGDNKFSAGFRFKVFNGTPVEKLATASAELKTRTSVVAILNGFKSVVGSVIDSKQKAMEQINKALMKKAIPQSIIDKVNTDATEFANDYSDSEADIKSFLDQIINSLVDGYAALAAEVSNLLYQRKGFVLEFAGATGYNTTNNNSLERLGLWANASYFISSDDLFTFTARYMLSNRDSSINNVDVGLGFLKKNDTYNISVEGLLRYYRAEFPDINRNNQPIRRVEKDITYRFAVQGSYLVSKDISINLSIGKDFNSPFITKSGFFSILGLNYSLFSKDLSKLK